MQGTSGASLTLLLGNYMEDIRTYVEVLWLVCTALALVLPDGKLRDILSKLGTDLKGLRKLQ